LEGDVALYCLPPFPAFHHAAAAILDGPEDRMPLLCKMRM
jgi:hypothetical protein